MIPSNLLKRLTFHRFCTLLTAAVHLFSDKCCSWQNLSLRMAAMAFQLMGLVLGIVAWCLVSSSTNSAMWKNASHGEAVVTASSRFEGLWMSCASNSLGATHCQRFKSVLGLPGETRARRGLRSYHVILLLGFSDTVSRAFYWTAVSQSCDQTRLY